MGGNCFHFLYWYKYQNIFPNEPLFDVHEDELEGSSNIEKDCLG